MKNYIQSQEFHNKIKDVAHHAFFKQVPKKAHLTIDNIYLAKQIHSNCVIEISSPQDEIIEADAIVTTTPNLTLAIKTADCVPVLLIDPKEYVIGAVHAGWKGAKSGIIENTLEKMRNIGAKIENIIAAIGPCIHQKSYEVDEQFLLRFIIDNQHNNKFFIPSKNAEHYMFDLPGYIVEKLKCIKSIFNCGIDTYTDTKHFSSYRRCTHQKKTLSSHNISTISILEHMEGIKEWQSLLQNINKKTQDKKLFLQRNINVTIIKQSYNIIDNTGSTLDLHGYNREDAYVTLSDFIKQQYKNNNRSLIIITGKGSGKIRESVYKWLEYSELSQYVLNYTQAKIQDGGEGVLYLQLKKKK